MSVRSELRPMLSLAWPVIVAELGWMAMGVVDTIMAGHLSAEALGAVGLGSILFVAVGFFGLGVLLSLDTVVAQAFGAGSMRECRRWLLHGVYLALIMTPPLMLLSFGLVASLPALGLHPDVLVLAEPYLWLVTWSALPLFLYAAFRRYLQAVNLVRPVMVTLIAANLVNALVNWLLIFGHLGFPAMGVRGAAWATVLSRVFMAGLLLAIAVRHAREHGPETAGDSWRLEPWRLGRLVHLGTPAALQLLAEVGVFAAVTALAGRFDPTALAAHQVALNLAGLTFMIPLGLSSAGAVRVGQAVGRGDPAGAAAAGWTAIVLGVGFMATAAVVFIGVPRVLTGLFTADAAVLATGVVLLRVAAAFQLFDGLQVVTTGILRGLGDTRTPMLLNLAGHWGIGLPTGYALAYTAGWGVAGLWVGLSIGLTIVGGLLLLAWRRRIRQAGRTARHDLRAPMENEGNGRLPVAGEGS